MTEDVHVRRMTECDAEPLVQLFQRCYGDTYPAAHFYDVAELSARIVDGRLRSVIAAINDDVVGHSSIRACHTDALVCETGHTVVDPLARGQGLLQKLGFALSQMTVEEGYTGYIHYPTTVHGIMQRASVAYGGHETGVMLAYLPVDTDYREFQQDAGRIAVTVAWQPLAAAPPRTVFLPHRYELLLKQLYGRLNLQRTIATNDIEMTPGPVQIETEYSPERSTVLIRLRSGSDNLKSVVDESTRKYASALTLVDLSLGSPMIDRHVEQLTDVGFFYAGLLPDFGASDVLRLQRLSPAEPASFCPQLENETGRELLEFIRNDAGIA